MNTNKTDDLPAKLQAVRRRFEQWRRTHRSRSPLPNALWAAAVKMAETYGLHYTARALPVEYYSLKKRVQPQSGTVLSAASTPRGLRERRRRPSAAAATFVELPLAEPAAACDCALELEDSAGAKMRIHLKAASPPDLATLCRSFWNPLP